MALLRYDKPDDALQGLMGAFPEIADAVERAEARTNKTLKTCGVSGEKRTQLVSDVMRACLADELGALSVIEGDVESGVRNSIVLRPEGRTDVQIRVLRKPGRGRVPTANSKARVREFEQISFDLGQPKTVTLTLTWRLAPEGVELDLTMPISRGSRRRGPDTAWSTVVPTHQDVPVVVEAVEAPRIDDLDIKLKPAAPKAEEGTDSA